MIDLGIMAQVLRAARTFAPGHDSQAILESALGNGGVSRPTALGALLPVMWLGWRRKMRGG